MIVKYSVKNTKKENVGTISICNRRPRSTMMLACHLIVATVKQGNYRGQRSIRGQQINRGSPG